MTATAIIILAALALFILLWRWVRSGRPGTLASRRSARLPKSQDSPFPLGEIAMRIFDPEDYTVLRARSEAGADLLFRRKQFALQWCERARGAAYAWLAEHRRLAAADAGTGLGSELRAIASFARVLLLIRLLQLLVAAFGAHRGFSMLRAISSSVSRVGDLRAPLLATPQA